MLAENDDRYIFTTLRYDKILEQCADNTAAADGISSAVYLLMFHHRRLCAAGDALFGGRGSEVLVSAGIASAQDLGHVVGAGVSQIASGTHGSIDHPAYRVRLQCDAQGRLKTSLIAIPSLSHDRLYPSKAFLNNRSTTAHEPWQVKLDQHPTTASIGTCFKTHDRSAYDRARQTAGLTSFAVPEEVLLFDLHGHIMDCSITTPYFYREGSWTTPSSSYGGQQGTTRAWALSTGICDERDVPVSSLSDGETIWLSNAARGFFLGLIHRTFD